MTISGEDAGQEQFADLSFRHVGDRIAAQWLLRVPPGSACFMRPFYLAINFDGEAPLLPCMRASHVGREDSISSSLAHRCNSHEPIFEGPKASPRRRQGTERNGERDGTFLTSPTSSTELRRWFDVAQTPRRRRTNAQSTDGERAHDSRPVARGDREQGGEDAAGDDAPGSPRRGGIPGAGRATPRQRPAPAGRGTALAPIRTSYSSLLILID